MKSILSIFLFALLLTSCADKQDKTIAINVLLLPSEQLYAHSLELNSLMLENNPNTMVLGEKRVPHITIVQAYIRESDLPKIEKSLTGLYTSIAKEEFYADSLVYARDKADSFAMIRIEKSESLESIHKKVVELVQPYVVVDGSQESFVSNDDGSDIDQFTLDYVPQFIEKQSYENYDPHLSLGVAETVFLDSLSAQVFKPMRFKATSISIYQMGEYGTAQKALWSSKEN